MQSALNRRLGEWPTAGSGIDDDSSEEVCIASVVSGGDAAEVLEATVVQSDRGLDQPHPRALVRQCAKRLKRVLRGP